MLEPAPMAQLPPVFPAMSVLFRRGTAAVDVAKKPTLLERPPPLPAGAVLVLSVTLKSFNAPPFSIPPPKSDGRVLREGDVLERRSAVACVRQPTAAPARRAQRRR